MNDSLGGGGNDDWMADALTRSPGEPLRAEVASHVAECLRCEAELSELAGVEAELRQALGAPCPVGDVECALRAVHGTGEDASLALFPGWAGLALAGALAAMLVFAPWSEPTTAPADGGSTPIELSTAGDPLAGLTLDERREVEEVLAGIGAEPSAPIPGAWDGWAEESYWDVADEVEGEALDGVERALDGLLEG